ncbi:aminotransferase class IV [Olivibacter sp. SDN3]|uniref:aminotransferase class IV n=1 Tax=Olivibacter sp. SDN3 TaxID=2764720 RepID=UPI001650EC74|nr:aminotransferase class IV [Olivibacter sp. SDN3]QNL48399.1 aminotransferase class IV [Olivibacter sp. SDN3]
MANKYPNKVYLNGEWLNADKAKVSVFDRGFMLGDGVYEVIPFYRGKPFLSSAHIRRLEYCLNEVSILLEQRFAWSEVIDEAIAQAGLTASDGAVYIQITRGAAPRTHYFPQNVLPTILIYAFELQLSGFEHRKAKVLVAKDLRWHRCDIKSTSLIANVQANEYAHGLAFDESILERNGIITEGTHTSFFCVRNGVVYTHPAGPHILPGITRDWVINMCFKLNIEIKEEALPINDLQEVDELFLTGTTAQILAVTEVMLADRSTITKRTGSITSKMQQAFIEEIENL